MARNKSLKTGLMGKASELHDRSEAQARAAADFLAASAKAQSDAQTAAIHAEAVEKALVILEEAGVSL